ncbi:hypothetical protein IWQ57_002743 [Coemansia nantahalensis]|uniref:Uncharacterized protein n=1 Tax=Coemansia nantahalensis TaxID=2789366 RepID=A0ACC1JZ36_9FUNG|nr:hypothetical protein IWQ57_002743 [Coemansia nantahalensis]
MGVGLLPDDILLLVLGHVISLSKDNVGEWKAQTAYLAVSRQWRRLALRLVSRRAVLVYRDRPASPEDRRWASNVPFIQGAACTHLIRTVTVNVSLSARPLHVLTSLASVLGIGAQKWRGVRTLFLTATHSASAPAWQQQQQQQDADSADPELRGIATWVARGMAAHMPNIRQLHVNGTSGHDACDVFTRLVAEGFALRLGAFCGCASALSGVASMGANLASLSVLFDRHVAEAFPRVSVEALRTLRLTDLPEDSLWARLAGGGAGHVRFASLESLALRYLAKSDYPLQDPVEQGSQVQLHFPRLRKLVIEHCPASSPLLAARTNPELLRDVTITDMSGRVEPGRLVCRNMDVLAVTSYSPRTRDAAFCDATNQLFGDRCVARSSSLTLGFSAAVPDPALVRWVALGRLAVFASVGSAVLLGLLARLPRLAELVVGGNVTHDCPATADSGCCRPTVCEQPISTSLRSLYFGDVFLTRAQGTTELLKHVLLNVPSLAELAFSQKHFDELIAFVRSSYACHPHLARITYNVLC